MMVSTFERLVWLVLVNDSALMELASSFSDDSAALDGLVIPF